MLVVLLLITDALLLLRLAGWPHFKYYVAKDVQFYFFNVTLITVINLGSAVVDQFKNINESLALMASRWYDRGTITLTVRKERIGYKPDSFPAELRRLQQYHNRLCDLIDKFNEVMGSVLLLAILYIVTSLLWDVSAVIEFFVKGCVIEGVRLDDLVLLDFLFWILISIGQTMFMARVGNAVVDENKRTLNYCYEFMNKLPSIPDTLVQRIRDNLRELANQVEARRPALTAAGIVKIDFRILGIVTTNTVTYVVVVLQFLFKQ
ncbi:uncharacterized protein LOC132705490 [Cylas formicarius]|uniref:uncharacterized protein LOC132705490 n=1 Tax=Cylas formicarius TaxID=197179 RepID=UPI0029585884|nr:uncharacterized protein LOC132705490 [Cylas formicarius]